MSMKTRYTFLFPLFLTLISPLGAPSLYASTLHGEEAKGDHRWTTNFSLQTDWHLAEKKQGASSPLSGMTYLDGVLRSKLLEVGLRLEEKQRPLPGREEEKGWGDRKSVV